MRKTEKRNVEVGYCDFCGKESSSLEKCAICKKDMCDRDGGKAHFAFSVEIFRYRDRSRFAGFGTCICKSCARKKAKGTVGELFDDMIDSRSL